MVAVTNAGWEYDPFALHMEPVMTHTWYLIDDVCWEVLHSKHCETRPDLEQWMRYLGWKDMSCIQDLAVVSHDEFIEHYVDEALMDLPIE